MGAEAEVRYSRLTPLCCSVNDTKGGTPGQLVGGMVEGQVVGSEKVRKRPVWSPFARLFRLLSPIVQCPISALIRT